MRLQVGQLQISVIIAGVCLDLPSAVQHRESSSDGG